MFLSHSHTTEHGSAAYDGASADSLESCGGVLLRPLGAHRIGRFSPSRVGEGPALAQLSIQLQGAACIRRALQGHVVVPQGADPSVQWQNLAESGRKGAPNKKCALFFQIYAFFSDCLR